jgi:hypothetical protein
MMGTDFSSRHGGAACDTPGNSVHKTTRRLLQGVDASLVGHAHT